MSSTNRGADRHAADYYVTPQKPILDFLRALADDDPTQFGCAADVSIYQRMASGIDVLDPCAGGDDRNEMSYPKALLTSKFPKINKITTVDYRKDSCAEYNGTDFLFWNPPQKYDMAITNPPFGLAQEIIDKCFDVVEVGGFVVMLLRLNFFGGEKRFDWWRSHMPAVCYIHSKRIGFLGHMQSDSPDFLDWRKTKGAKYDTDERALSAFRTQTDSIEYMHAVWVVGETPRFTALRIL